jgi:hypothetical protein
MKIILLIRCYKFNDTYNIYNKIFTTVAIGKNCLLSISAEIDLIVVS